MRCLVFSLLLLVSRLGFASVPLQASLDELAQGADHILVGRVVGVDMVDADGQQVLDEAQGTGPGLKNTIRLHIAVDEVLVTNAAQVPSLLKVPLDPFMHYRLGQVRAAHAGVDAQVLVLLRGEDYLPVVAGVFTRGLADKAEALRIHAAHHPRSRGDAGVSPSTDPEP